MDIDPDIAIASIEQESAPSSAEVKPEPTLARSQTQSSSNTWRDSSPSRTPFKTPRSRPATPSTRSTSRSPSVASVRNDRPQPSLDKRRSIPNLSATRNSTPSQPQFRRASSILNPATPNRSKSAMSSPPVDKPKPTAADVAKEFFKRDLAGHANQSSRTVVFTHDSCYGHRYARPRASKAQLASIVERPERIHATLLGASTAYVRLGQRHKDGENGPHPDRDIQTLGGHPFLIRKSTRSVALNHPAVTHVHGTKWMEELQIMCDTAEAKLAMNGKELTRPIGYGKDDKGVNLPTLHTGDLYLAAESLDALQGCLGGVCDAVDAVFSADQTRRAFVCIRPPGHHCSANVPSGFCWLNNVHVGITYAAINHGLTHAAIIDFDLHHGDGSQSIAWSHNSSAQSLPKNAAGHRRTPIGYYSIHDINSYPCEMGDEDKVRNASVCVGNAHGQSIWNVHLESWQSKPDFWRVYEDKYKILLKKAREFLRSHSDRLRTAGIEPKSAIFLSSGFDASEWESEFMQRHKVNVPTEFYAKFTADTVHLANEAGLGVDGRVISVLEGGYSDRALTSGVLSHLCGLTIGTDAAQNSGQAGSLTAMQTSTSGATNDDRFDPAWWARENLELLEGIVAGHLPPPAKKAADKMGGTYSSPTQASTARMTDVARERTSLSAKLEARLFLESQPPDPPPEVDWVTAAYELSRLLIPADRQTLSCTHEELNAEATKARRARVSDIGAVAPVPVDAKMQLRDRKARGNASGPPPVASRSSNRRTTIAAVADLPDPEMRNAPADRPRRRSSAGSSVLSSFQDLKLDEDLPLPTARAPAAPKPKATEDGGAGIPLKKTRAPQKRPPSRTNSPRKAKSTAKTTTVQTTERKSSADSRPTTARSSSRTTPELNGIDSLTDGMKKINIKLKMPTQEQHDAKRKIAEEAKLQKAKPARNPPVPKTMKSKVPTKSTTNAITKALPSEAQNSKTEPLIPQAQFATQLSGDAPSNTDQLGGFGPAQHGSNGDTPLANESNSSPTDATTYNGMETIQNAQHDGSEDRSATLDQTLKTNRVDRESLAAVPYPMLPHLHSQHTMEDNKIAPITEDDVVDQSSDHEHKSAFPISSSIGNEEANGGAKPSIWDIPETPMK